MFENSDIIHAYSRAETIEDGVLFDITSHAKQCGVVIHAATTSALFEALKPTAYQEKFGQSLDARLFDMLLMFRLFAKASKDQSLVLFKIKVSGKFIYIKAIISNGDNGEPVLTFMLPHED